MIQQIPLLGIYPQIFKTFVHEDICILLSIAALFMVTQTWWQPECPGTEGWMKQMWYRHTMECYSAMRKDEILPFVTTQGNLENIMLSKISQKQLRTVGFHSYVGYKTETHRYRQWELLSERSGLEVKGTKCIVTEDGLTLSAGHTTQYTDHVSQKCTLKPHMILLINVTPTNFIKK